MTIEPEAEGTRLTGGDIHAAVTASQCQTEGWDTAAAIRAPIAVHPRGEAMITTLPTGAIADPEVAPGKGGGHRDMRGGGQITQLARRLRGIVMTTVVHSTGAMMIVTGYREGIKLICVVLVRGTRFEPSCTGNKRKKLPLLISRRISALMWCCLEVANLLVDGGPKRSYAQR